MIKGKQKYSIYYEIIFTVLAVIAVTIAILDITGKIELYNNKVLYITDYTILFIFIVDYFARLIWSSDKKSFVMHNIPDLIAIIPFSSFFKAFRIVKLIKLTRLIKLTKLARVIAIFTKMNRSASKFLKTNGFIYMLNFAIFVIILGAVSIYIAEKNITVDTFSDAIWWSFVTATTVGYGDISPSTPIGRFIAAILMLVGIGTIGLLTGTIATFFIKDKKDVPLEQNTNKILDLSALSDDDFNLVSKFAEYLHNK